MTETFDSPKAWAISKGYPVKAGKGRMPKAISDEWQSLLRAGKVALTPKTTARPKPARVGKPADSADSGNTAKPEKRQPKLTENGIVEPAPKIWPDNTVCYWRNEGKKIAVSLRQCCFHCGVSLQWCGCGAPKALATPTSGYVPVTLEIPGE